MSLGQRTARALHRDSHVAPPAVAAPPAAHASRDLDGADPGALEQALAVLLSPLDYPDLAAWGDAAARALGALLGADAAVAILPGDGAAAADRLGQPGQAGIWLRVIAADGSLAAVCAYWHRVRDSAPAVAAVASFHALAPAFRAGVEAWLRVAAQRHDLARVLDSLSDAALLFDTNGTPVYANAAVHRRTASAEDRVRLRGEAQRVAWTLGAAARRGTGGSPAARSGAAGRRGASLVRDLRLGATVYTLRGSLIGGAWLGRHRSVLVTIASAAAEPMSDATLSDRFGLTAREIEVARLVAAGLSNNEIAQRLGVRFFTARNHVERVLAKLGVASRNRVGPLLRGDGDAERSTAAA